jgi:hypothetical protein
MSKRKVLVAIINNKLDFAVLREQLWYRIPVSSVEKWIKERWAPKWLAFYQTAGESCKSKACQHSVRPTGGIRPDLQAFFYASGFSCSRSESHPAHQRLTQTVGLLVSLHSHLLHHSPSISMITADYKTATKAIANEKHPLV